MAYVKLPDSPFKGTCTSGSGADGSAYSEFWVDVYYEQNITNNTTSLMFKPYVLKKAHGESVTWYFKLDGNDYYNVFCNTYQNSRVDGGTAYKTIYHNNDGSCTTTLNVSVETSYTNGANANLNNACMKWGRLSKSVTLPTIPRASTFTTSGQSLGSNLTINISPYVSSFRHTITYQFGSISRTIASNVENKYVYAMPIEDCAQIPNSETGTGTITVSTYNGSALVGSASKVVTLKVPSSVKPSIGNVAIYYHNAMTNGKESVNIAGRTTATMNIENVGTQYGATVKSYSITGPNLNVNKSSGEVRNLPAGNSTYTYTVTDSRGRTTSVTKTVRAESYTAPKITNVSVYRTNSSGAVNDGGTYVKIAFKATVDNPGGNNVNSKYWQLDWKERKASSWNICWKSGFLSAYSETVDIGVTGGWDVSKAYDIRIRLMDYYHSDADGTWVPYTASIGTSSCAFNIEDNGIGVGKYHEKGGLDVRGEIYSDGNKVPTIKSADGVMEVGQYIDMHHGNFSNDYDVRFEVSNTRNLEIRPEGKWATVYGGLGVNEGNGNQLDLIARSDGVSMGNTSCWKYLRIANNGWLYYNGDIAINRLGISDTRGTNPAPNDWSNYQMSLDFKTSGDLGLYGASTTWNNVLTTKGWSSDNTGHPVSQLAFNGHAIYYHCSNGSNGWNGWARIPMLEHKNGYWGFGCGTDNFATWLRVPSDGLIPHSSGGNSSSLGTQSWMFKEVHGKTFYMANGRAMWGNGNADIMTNSSILPDADNAKFLGWTNNRWGAVYSNKGSIQTSDIRYKSDIKKVDDKTFFDMIKGTGVHTYVINDQRLDKGKVIPLTEDTAPQDSIHIGILAQEMAEYDGYQYILNYDEEAGYSVNSYNLTSAVMSALKEEIRRREELEEKVKQMEQRMSALEELLLQTLQD